MEEPLLALSESDKDESYYNNMSKRAFIDLKLGIKRIFPYFCNHILWEDEKKDCIDTLHILLPNG